MRDKSDHTKVLIALLVGTVCGGSNFVFVKLAVSEIQVTTFIAIRFFFAFLFAFVLFSLRGFKLVRVGIRELMVAILFAGNVFFFAYGIKYTSASSASVIITLIPIFVLVLSHFMIKDRINRRKIAGIVLGGTGALIIVLLPLLDTEVRQETSLFGNVILVASAFSFSLYNVLSKPITNNSGIEHLNVTIYAITFLIAVSILNVDFSDALGILSQASPNALGATAIVTIFGTIVLYGLYLYVVKHGGALMASTQLYLQPVVAVILSSIFLQETLPLTFFIGAILAFSGAYIVSRGSQITSAAASE